MQNYELLLILPGTLSEDETDPLLQKVSKIIEDAGGINLSIEKIEKRRLAYPIKHIRYGYFNLIYFDAEPEAVVQVGEKLGLVSELLRVLLQKSKPNTGRTIEFGHPMQGKHKDDRENQGQRSFESERRDKKKTEEGNIEERVSKKDNKDVEDSEKNKTEVILKAEKETETETEIKKESVIEVEIEAEKEKLSKPLFAVNTEAKKKDKKKIDMDDIDKKLDEILDIDLSSV